MRRAAPALLLILQLGACAPATGTSVGLCDASWRLRDAETVEPGGVDERAVPIECMRPIERRRVRIGFVMPPGPECHVLSRVDVVETADAVSVTLLVARRDDPNAGACSEAAHFARTEIDLQQAVGSRRLLDGSRRPERSPETSP